MGLGLGLRVRVRGRVLGSQGLRVTTKSARKLRKGKKLKPKTSLYRKKATGKERLTWCVVRT